MYENGEASEQEKDAYACQARRMSAARLLYNMCYCITFQNFEVPRHLHTCAMISLPYLTLHLATDLGGPFRHEKAYNTVVPCSGPRAISPLYSAINNSLPSAPDLSKGVMLCP